MEGSKMMGEEVLLLLIGAAIGVISSIGTLFAERWFNHRGSIKIYHRIFGSAPNRSYSYGFRNSDIGSIAFIVPVDFEIQNTSNATRVIRDLSIVLYNGQRAIRKMVQIQNMRNRKTTGNEVKETETIEYGVDQNSYSLMLQPTSIQKIRCMYILKIHQTEVPETVFDSIRLEYYDEKDRKQSFELSRIEKCWQIMDMKSTEDWTRVK